MGNSESSKIESESNSEFKSPINVTVNPTIETGDIKINTNGIQESTKNDVKN
jgi:hypothetical protein